MTSMHLILIGLSVLHARTGGLNEQKLDKPVLKGPSIALKDTSEYFYCEIPGHTAAVQVHYELYVETNMDKIISEHTSLTGDTAALLLFVREHHDGRLICKASAHNNTDIQSSYSDAWELRVITPVKGLGIISHPSSLNVWEGQTLTLQCKKAQGTYVSYDWFLNDKPVQMQYDRNNDTLIIHRLSARHTGDYTCVASNQFNDTIYNSSSEAVTVNVKEYLTKPEILFDVVKIEDCNYKAMITCRSERGTPQNTFTLLNHTQIITNVTTQNTSAVFSVPIQMNIDMGRMKCNASNEGNWVMSEPTRLFVEPVGGAVTLTPFKHIKDFQVVGVGLLCKVERGTFPVYRWFHNGSRLTGRGDFYAVAYSDESFLSLSVSRNSNGFYHCDAADRFDNSSSISSAKMIISEEALNSVSPLVAVVVFTCFAVLIVAVTTCCMYGVMLRRRYSSKYPLNEQRGINKIPVKDEEEDDDYLMLEGYDEDVTHADRMSDSNEEEDESVDETLLYEGAAPE
uniref:Si:dkey-93h22.7 n=1 Tax=Danio rerio TaxID=7955 RepID=A0A0R4IQ34_DANRE|nr:Fc receptor-like protein 5 isoform X1 [Danio rerio]|eukprot:XP_009304605.1 Fc receptor-like protein 5 isoform X1 [Danio rerio]